jgi:hypothetical protein
MVHDLKPPDLSSAELTPPDTRTPGSDEYAGRMNSLYRMVWVLFGFVFALTLVVLVFLPYLVTEQKSADHGPVPESENTAQPAKLAASVSRHDAEQALQEFLRLRAQPDLANAELWAEDQWQAAMDTALAGDNLLGRASFIQALSSYQDATRQLRALLDSRAMRLSEKLATGWQLLEQNNASEAVLAFEQALAMQEDNEQARRGLTQAKVRDEVLKTFAQGQQAEAMNNPQLAAAAYAAALQLDPLFVPAQMALKRSEETLASLAFQNAMSDALEGLERGKLADAERALKAAAMIYPDQPVVRDSQRRLAIAKRQYRLDSLRRQATQRARNEDWSAAAELYGKALAIDGQIAYARNGLSHAQKRLQLHAQLDHYLADTLRLSSDEPLANARRLLQANRALPDNEPQLAKKFAMLEEAARLAVVPVKVLMRSDNRTEVAIYHIGRFGRFLEKQITLRPGRYTVTGSCPGFRDVRKVIILRPDSPSLSLLIRCEEPI